MQGGAPVGFRLSPTQEWVWSNAVLRCESIHAQIQIDGPLDAAKLRDCLEQIVRRHEVLRTVFKSSRGVNVPFQVVEDSAAFDWETVVTDNVGTSTHASPPADLLAPIAWRSVAPESGPAFAARLIQVAPHAHVLALRASSMCFDATSLEVLLAELAALYQDGAPDDNIVQYADFAQWHSDTLATPGRERDAAGEFWSANRPPTSAPLGIATSPTVSTARLTHAFSLGGCQLPESPGDRQTLLLACWYVLLRRLGVQELITTNVVSSRRPSEELQSSIGPYARPVPVSVSFEDQPAFTTILRRARESLEQAEQWLTYCPPGLIGDIGFEFTHLSAAVSAGPTTFTPTSLSTPGWMTHLSLVCRSGAGGMALELVYAPEACEPREVERLARYFARTVQAALANPDCSVVEFDLLTNAEHEQLAALSCGESCDTGDARTFHELFEAQARLTPDRPAVRFEDCAFTYAQLNARANQIAHRLQGMGVTPGSIVGLCLERSAEMIVALLGIIKAGCAYVPLLPDIPQARLSQQIRETRLQALVTMQPLLARLPDSSGRLLCLDRDQAELEREPTANPACAATPEDLIYVLYTSGSTGTPKGVAVRHRNITSYVSGVLRRLDVPWLSTSPGLTFATVSTLGADLGNTAIFPALVTGGCIAVISHQTALDGADYAKWNKRHAIDVLKITPSNLSALLESGTVADVLPRRFLVTGGEACSWKLADVVLGAGKCVLMNHYGPTEATVGCLTYMVPGAGDAARPDCATVPLGKPLPDTQIHILDRLRRLVPPGVPGEIHIGGAGITAGYLGRPTETQQRFIEHPTLSRGTPLYGTGDLARMLPDGSVEFLGRLDDQIKIRGHRVELAEIESTLCLHPKVRQSVVLLSEDATGQFLMAFVVSAAPLSAADVQQYLRTLLPEYMIPRDITNLEHLPLNANGKVDRRQLKQSNLATQKSVAELVEPRDELETQLLAIWKGALQRERMGVRDNFFDMGGHSLLATQVVARIRANLQLNASIRMMFDAPTVEQLAQAIRAEQGSAAAATDEDESLEGLEGLADAQFPSVDHDIG